MRHMFRFRLAQNGNELVLLDLLNIFFSYRLDGFLTGRFHCRFCGIGWNSTQIWLILHNYVIKIRDPLSIRKMVTHGIDPQL